MIYYSQPYSTEKDIGDYYNKAMGLLKPNDWMVFTDGDTIFTTPDYGSVIDSAINKYGDGIYTCYTNRVGCNWQVYPAEWADDDYSKHRQVGNTLRLCYYDECEEHTTSQLMSGHCIIVSKKVWDKIGGCKNGILGVDNDIHMKAQKHKIPVRLIKGLYVYHWYRGGKDDKSHLE